MWVIDRYTYTYDAVGNILTKTACLGGAGCTPQVTADVYDDANRLSSVGGVAYSWDNNGNLRNDGVFTYSYDAANRLITVTDGITMTGFTYNGLGVRVAENDNGVVTTYTVDLAAGLTQVLADGTNTYLSGNGRIAQYTGTNAQYFLGDALGSVRQLADGSGAVTLARSYEPYGSMLSSAGTGTTYYGFTGEWANSTTGLIDLRARHYDLILFASVRSPGSWKNVNESMSNEAAAYQSRVTGRRPGQAYVVNGVKFDGFRKGVLIDAKGPGYANFVEDGKFVSWFTGRDDLLDQANRQLAAANGVPIEWYVAEEDAANAIRDLFSSNGYGAIKVTWKP